MLFKSMLWLLRLLAAIILLQTLYFKFSGQPESVALFSKLGVEPWGRILTGVFELIAAVLLLIPATTVWGALLTSGLMAGAILSHLTVLGISSDGDGGVLFFLAWLVMGAALLLLFFHRSQVFKLISKQ